MIDNFLLWLTSRLPCRLITTNGNPYLERYYITRNIYLHRFVSSDSERHLHDHPWKYGLGVILTGSYTEELIDDSDNALKYRVRKWINFVPGDKYHRIIFTEPKTWTLFIRGKRVKHWGFLNHGKYTRVPYEKLDVMKYPIRGNK